MPPTSRERHSAIVHESSIFIFGGYDRNVRLNDFYEFNTENFTWQEVIYSGSGLPPTPRHSMCAVVHDGNVYVFSGYDGSCRSDLHRFNFETNTWSEIKRKSNSPWPKERYRTSAVINKNCLYIYGGHDGTKQLEDFWVFDLKRLVWEEKIIKQGQRGPGLRDSHITFTYKDSIFVHGGAAVNKNELFEYSISKQHGFIIKVRIDGLQLK